MRLKKGSKVEVLASTEGPCVEFRCAQIISGNGRTYSVQYECSTVTSEAGVQRIQRKAIRPCPPLIEGVESWKACDIVEVYDAGSWKVATVLKVLGRDFYLVRCLSSCKQMKVHKDGMRVRQSWINDQWIINQQDLGNSGGGKSSCNLISNSYKVMHEVQQPGTRKSQQDRSDCFSSTNANALYKPFAASSTGLKRLSPYGNSAVDAYPKKMRAVINKTEYERSKVVPTAQKVDVIAYPQNKMGEKCMYDSIINGTNQYCETWKKPPHVTTCYFERIAEPDYSCNDLSSVGSCSVIGSSTSRSSSNMLAGSCHDEDTLSSDAESLNVGDLDKGCPISPEEDVAEGIHRVELHAYRSTLEAIYASGSLSWEQEELLTNLRISLHISNDEHLMEIKNLASVGQNF
ncbi:hypothetical protein HN51_020402 [Arachis hypogaea]|uniref:ENT domain-containing protein n=1 Tax=Arachis hypogaea TaxID=3818 RepID=A0A445C0T6_ARAHY|nr:uncharacterized protein LOC112707869 isoform X1 [Arachis hypogaea]RYR44531.1 hypothetical protein Ahy_A08g040853 isoform C [Arachis hypogaea]